MEGMANVIYEDRDLVVLDKRAGVVTTREGRVGEGETLEDWVKARWGINLPRGGLVHRLDKGTSGIILLAKNEKAWQELREQFKKRTVKKIYWALAAGRWPRQGTIKAPIRRFHHKVRRFKVGVDGRRAETDFRVRQFLRDERGRDYSLLEINLKTGRTHQIRVHLSYLGWPIVGDRLYGGEKVGELERQFLHAKRISFVHPGSGKVVEFESPLPQDLNNLLLEYEKETV